MDCTIVDAIMLFTIRAVHKFVRTVYEYFSSKSKYFYKERWKICNWLNEDTLCFLFTIRVLENTHELMDWPNISCLCCVIKLSRNFLISLRIFLNIVVKQWDQVRTHLWVIKYLNKQSNFRGQLGQSNSWRRRMDLENNIDESIWWRIIVYDKIFQLVHSTNYEGVIWQWIFHFFIFFYVVFNSMESYDWKVSEALEIIRNCYKLINFHNFNLIYNFIVR